MQSSDGRGAYAGSVAAGGAELEKLLEKYSSVFREDLPSGLLPEREVDHAIETDDSVKPPHRPLYQLSPVELVAVKEYVMELLRKGKFDRASHRLVRRYSSLNRSVVCARWLTTGF